MERNFINFEQGIYSTGKKERINMINYTHRFSIFRSQDESDEEIEITLEADFDVEPFIPGKYFREPEDCYPDEGGVAYLKDKIFIIHDDDSKEIWSGQLSAGEREAAEEEAYLNCIQDNNM